MRWTDYVNGAVTAALSGGATTAGAMIIDPEHFNLGLLKHLGIVFSAGAIMGLINWLRQSPWKQASDTSASVDPRRFMGSGSLALFAAIALSSAACGTTVRHVAVTADIGYYTLVTQIDDAQFNRCHSATMINTPAWCGTSDAPIKAALQHGLAATKVLQATPRNAASLPKDLPALTEDLVTLRDIVAPLTDDPVASAIASKTTAALNAALAVLSAFAGGK